MKTSFEKLKIDGKNKNILSATIQLALIKAKKSPLIEYMQKNVKEDVSIEEVRKRLAKIRNEMAADIIESRTERI